MEENVNYEDDNSISVGKAGFNAGLLFGLIMVVFTIIVYATDLVITQSWITSLSYVIIIIGTVYAHNQFKKKGDGFMSYGQGLGIGTIVSLIAGTLSSIFVLIYIQFIDTGYQSRQLEEQRRIFEEEGLSDQQIDSALGMTEAFSNPFLLLVLGIIVTTLIGFVLSLIISAFTKKSDPTLD